MSPFADYVGHGWKLTPIEPGEKLPTHRGWNHPSNVVTHPLSADRLNAAGLCHAYSGTCAIDIDDFEKARAWFVARNIDLDALFHAPGAVRIQSPKDNRGKLLYALPSPLPSKKILDGKQTVLEFRCATVAGLTMQDVLPPSPYPNGGHYQWVGDWRQLPTLPAELRREWEALITPVEPDDRATEPTISKPELAALVSELNPDSSYDDWLRIGMAIHHEYAGSEEGFALWLAWSAQGSKFKGEHDLRPHWDSFSSGGGVTGLSLKQMQGPSLDAFPVVNLATASPVEVPEYLTPADVLAPRDLPPFLIGGVLEYGSECSIIGPTGSYKSLFAFRMAANIATGTDFFGRPCGKGLVVMLVGEGRGGIDRRLQALQSSGIDITGAPLAIYPKALALPRVESVEKIRALIQHAEQRFQQRCVLVIIDTYSRYAAGDEDKTGDTYEFFKAARIVRGNAALVVCHHTGHGDKSRARGSSAWGQLVDTEFVANIDESSGVRIFHNTKQKDSEPCAPMYFTLAQMPTKLTRQGEPITSVVLEPTVIESPTASLNDNEQIVYDVVTGNAGLTEDEVISMAATMVPKPSGRDTRKMAMRRALQVLVQNRRLSINNGRVEIVNTLENFVDLIGAPIDE